MNLDPISRPAPNTDAVRRALEDADDPYTYDCEFLEARLAPRRRRGREVVALTLLAVIAVVLCGVCAVWVGS
jgi:hypothetical protein